MNLSVNSSKGNKIKFNIVGQNAVVEILSTPKTTDWNLCRIASDATTRVNNSDKTPVKTVRGEFLSVAFQSSEAREKFQKSIKTLQYWRTRIESERQTIPGILLRPIGRGG
jgi:hypothetical protein